ncbi:DUF58 domain-containing protein [Solilutibacter tolerans]|uniref:DUF58 domain-containing protein n=1 Tax=Solilutibacter tolerans TaxID=1604334 RepID=A0A1N6UEZ8_9GAMM|nr:DUF58 domain-containing protein [Lysobacter tolerans]SIQ63886.1 Protein of unknown function DUF58 [Lysobacter tolerans]
MSRSGTPEDAVAPTLPALVALRQAVQGRAPARKGRHGASGIALSPLRGRGMEYAESREYVVGDDARHIDWRLTARNGRTHTKLYQAERDRLTLIVGDTSPALYFGTRTRFKSVQAARAGAVAAWAALRDGDRVAAMRGSLKEPPISPGNGMKAVMRVLDALRRWYASPPDEDVGLAVGLDHAQRVLRPGSRLIVLAEPASVMAVPDARWAALARHNEVIVLLITDAFEQQPPHDRLRFAHGSSRLELDLAGKAQRAQWAKDFSMPLQEAAAKLKARGIRAIELSADADSSAWLPAPRRREVA